MQRFGGLVNLNVHCWRGSSVNARPASVSANTPSGTRTVLPVLGLPCTLATFAPTRAPPQAELWFDDVL